MQAEFLGGLGDVAVEVVEDALDVFPFDTGQGRYGNGGQFAVAMQADTGRIVQGRRCYDSGGCWRRAH